MQKAGNTAAIGRYIYQDALGRVTRFWVISCQVRRSFCLSLLRCIWPVPPCAQCIPSSCIHQWVWYPHATFPQQDPWSSSPPPLCLHSWYSLIPQYLPRPLKPTHCVLKSPPRISARHYYYFVFVIFAQQGDLLYGEFRADSVSISSSF